MIIGVSGKISSGKDTVGSIIQYLIDSDRFNYKISELNLICLLMKFVF